jgi:hypothetical protein
MGAAAASEAGAQAAARAPSAVHAKRVLALSIRRDDVEGPRHWRPLTAQPSHLPADAVNVRTEVVTWAVVGGASTFALAYVLRATLAGRRGIGVPSLVALPGAAVFGAGGYVYATLRNRISP